MRQASARGFTLVELAVVLAIAALLLSSLMYTLSAQTEQRARDNTLRSLEQAKELLLTFAIVNRRLPCPATCSNAPTCDALATDVGDESVSGGACTDGYTGYLPGRAIGFQPTDALGYALDPWGNRIRYALAQTISLGTTPHFTNAANLKANGVTTTPTDLLICSSSTGTGFVKTFPGNTCGTASGASVTNQNVIAAIVWSHGKNYRSMSSGNDDEQINNKHRLPTALNNNPTFIWHEPRPVGATGGEFDDLVTWIPVGLLYGRMIAAGVLP